MFIRYVIKSRKNLYVSGTLIIALHQKCAYIYNAKNNTHVQKNHKGLTVSKRTSEMSVEYIRFKNKIDVSYVFAGKSISICSDGRLCYIEMTGLTEITRGIIKRKQLRKEYMIHVNGSIDIQHYIVNVR